MKRYAKSEVAILISSLFSEGGDWRSIYFFAKRLEAQGRSIALVSVNAKRGFRQMWAAAVFAPRLLVNGLGTLTKWPMLLICLWRKDARIYLHETGYMLDEFKACSPYRYRILSRILSRNPLLCVSKQAEEMYRQRFGSARTHVVYECPGDVRPPDLDPSKKNIVMVGSINERKGAELFSRVADLAAEKHPEWVFHWIGSKASMNKLYQSENVTWHGWQWNPREFVYQCDLFFLSSIDDPCPLAALEAIHMGKRCVAFSGTGTAELISNLENCEIFSHFSEQAALAAIDGCLNRVTRPLGEATNYAIDRTSPKGFEKSILRTFES